MRALVLATLVLLGPACVRAQEEDRWQATLNDGRTLWDLHLRGLRGDTLVLQHAESTYRFPIKEVDELRLVRKSERRQTPEANRYAGVLGGADDEVYRLTLYTVPERRQILEQVLKDHPPPGAP